MGIRIQPVILAGGGGERLWPLSRQDYPKAFIGLAGEWTLIQETARRVADHESFAPPVVVVGENHRFVAAEQLRQAGVTPKALLLEPEGRNTAPALAVAANLLAEEDPIMLVMPSDHRISDVTAFLHAVEQAASMAAQGWLVSLGVQPERIETGYGYIRCGEALEVGANGFHVEAFIEKPDAVQARELVSDETVLWNSGIFVMKASAYLSALALFVPQIRDQAQQALRHATRDYDYIWLDAASFMASPSLSIDHAVMEKTDQAAVVPVSMGWSDVGSFAALWALQSKDAWQNAVHGSLIAIDAHHNLVHSPHQLVAMMGVEQLLVVVTPDAVLVAHQDRAQDIRLLVEQLKLQEHPSQSKGALTYRPWGYYEPLYDTPKVKAKRLHIRPGAKLSLQKHQHRSEHWVVVSGMAHITREEEEFLLAPHESAFVPCGALHRIANAGDEALVMIEVQTGDYLGEDDIIRVADDFGRV